ncbi:hypothetical protein EX30DRAFT_139099 [Ascodesmis nigricans]|uniref:Uncharacterized protein n=1 Tax=Ascodesmis nigricans TaxID=341454 RepID=A0A4S2N1C3_9PEZI|nr:hypothetical protein EX30DRAFT_139099 [Ascodesmis nigricans]
MHPVSLLPTLLLMALPMSALANYPHQPPTNSLHLPLALDEADLDCSPQVEAQVQQSPAGVRLKNPEIVNTTTMILPVEPYVNTTTTTPPTKMKTKLLKRHDHCDGHCDCDKHQAPKPKVLVYNNGTVVGNGTLMAGAGGNLTTSVVGGNATVKGEGMEKKKESAAVGRGVEVGVLMMGVVAVAVMGLVV